MLKVREKIHVPPKWIHEETILQKLTDPNVPFNDTHFKVVVSVSIFKNTPGCPYDHEEVKDLSIYNEKMPMWAFEYKGYYYAKYDNYYFIIGTDDENIKEVI